MVRINKKENMVALKWEKKGQEFLTDQLAVFEMAENCHQWDHLKETLLMTWKSPHPKVNYRHSVLQIYLNLKLH